MQDDPHGFPRDRDLTHHPAASPLAVRCPRKVIVILSPCLTEPDRAWCNYWRAGQYDVNNVRFLRTWAHRLPQEDR
jgi:hypothetical protein